MLRKSGFSCAGALLVMLLLQSAHALPPVKRAAGDETQAPLSRMQLLLYTLTEMTELAKFTLRDGGTVLGAAVDELKALPERSSALQANITRLERFVGRTKSMSTASGLLSVRNLFTMRDFGSILRDYESMPANSEQTRTLKTALESGGLLQFRAEFEERFAAFARRFESAFARFANGLGEKGKAKNAKFLAWFERFKAAPTTDEKMVVFEDFQSSL